MGATPLNCAPGVTRGCGNPIEIDADPYLGGYWVGIGGTPHKYQ